LEDGVEPHGAMKRENLMADFGSWAVSSSCCRVSSDVFFGILLSFNFMKIAVSLYMLCNNSIWSAFLKSSVLATVCIVLLWLRVLTFTVYFP
jgi:Na+/H+ antiporter NhaA